MELFGAKNSILKQKYLKLSQNIWSQNASIYKIMISLTIDLSALFSLVEEELKELFTSEVKRHNLSPWFSSFQFYHNITDIKL